VKESPQKMPQFFYEGYAFGRDGKINVPRLLQDTEVLLILS
jgi:hypothetical protein